jgi:hypothetical protein
VASRKWRFVRRNCLAVHRHHYGVIRRLKTNEWTQILRSSFYLTLTLASLILRSNFITFLSVHSKYQLALRE